VPRNRTEAEGTHELDKGCLICWAFGRVCALGKLLVSWLRELNIALTSASELVEHSRNYGTSAVYYLQHMKKLIVCLTLAAAFAITSLQAAENNKDKSACSEKAQSACCEGQAKTACQKANASKTASKKAAATARGGQLAQR